MARGTAPVGGLLPRPLGSAQWSTTTSTPVNRADTSNATPLDAAIKRLTTRSANNVRRGPAIRHRLAFAGSMRRPGNF
jgi:hypothetical protein